MAAESKSITEYFRIIAKEVESAHRIATAARQKNFDPEPKVDIILAANMAERVTGLISTVAPELTGTKIITRIQELEQEHGILAWEVALKIAEEVAAEKFCKFRDRREALEVGIRMGMAYNTLGIVAAPLEGFIELRIKKTRDGKEYLAPFYAGPIRGAGGTAAAFSVIITDYLRAKFGYAKYDPTEEEIKRYGAEVRDYHERVTNLQYFPSEEEVQFLARHVPVEVNGDPTETVEVSNYKDLPRVETNRIRGGVCLVMAEGLAQKSPKLWKRLSKWGKQMGLEWEFLEEFLAIQKKHKAAGTAEDANQKIMPNLTYMKDLVAGRPILSMPMRSGGFRLRYGRSRFSGYSSAAIHPATMHALSNFIAVGTQLKVERPGKAAAITTCEEIEGPVVRLNDGTVEKLSTEKEALQAKNNIREILYLGDILISYGDFSENGHKLVPAGYCEEWWALELEKATVNMFGALDLDKLSELVGVSADNLEKMLKQPRKIKLTGRAAINVSLKTKVPLHPEYTVYWNSLAPDKFLHLADHINRAKMVGEDTAAKKIIMPDEKTLKRSLEVLGLPHKINSQGQIEISDDNALTFLACFGQNFDIKAIEKTVQDNRDKTVLEIVNMLSPFRVRDKGGTFIGARMGRPEKAKMRKMDGQPQILFPVGDEGGRLRAVQSAMEGGKIMGDFPVYWCAKCNRETICKVCETCGTTTAKKYYCKECGLMDTESCPKHGPNRSYRRKDIDITHYFSEALRKLQLKSYPELIKGVRGTSNKDHIPEHLAKGVLRAVHDIYVNKDGTTRYDMTELAITHFKPAEIGASIEKLKSLGYEYDCKGIPLTSPDQIVELYPQDIILPGYELQTEEPAGQVLLRVAQFIDEMLVRLYGLEPYYKLQKVDDLIGHLVIGLAPHISAGMVGRIIGFSKTQGCLAHPLYHAALRRDCDGDEACVMLLMDGFLNFSRQFLPDKRGSRTMDSPLVLSIKLIPSEVDDMVQGLDVRWEYPLDLYEGALDYKFPWEIKIEQLRDRLGTEKQYEKIGFTHGVEDINQGVLCSAYKTLPSMEEKLKGQMEIASRIRAVDENEVAQLVIEKHFIRDIKGNLRKFSQQQFRCVKCNEKFRRPPLIGKCTKCGGKIIFTISEGSIIKYLEPSISLAEKYNVSAYLKQTLLLTKQRIEQLFGKEKERQAGLGAWFG